MPKPSRLPTFSKDDVEVLHRSPCYEGFFRVEKLQLRHRLFDGGWSDSVSRELFVRGDATCMLPYDPMRGNVVLLEQFRIGALDSGNSPWLMELVAGINGPGEPPEDVARRESLEESDLVVKGLMPIHRYLVSPGGTSERIHLFLGFVDSTDAGGIHGLDEEHEDIRVHVLPLEDACQLVDTGVIDNAAAIIALQWIQLHRKAVDDCWRSRVREQQGA